MRFTKMQGLGNDYIYVNCFDQQVLQPEALAQQISDRHFGVGSDGLILILPSEIADVRMRMFNADGSEAQMCGNGIRCLAKYCYTNNLAKLAPSSSQVSQDFLTSAAPAAARIGQITVETAAGVLTVAIAIDYDNVAQLLCVDMGAPILEPGRIPMRVSGDDAIAIPLTVGTYDLSLTCVSMGNPHAVAYCPDVNAIELELIGSMVEQHEIFPEKVNVHFVQVLSSNEVNMRTWERGSGITLACGTGAAAVCVAGVLTGQTDRQILAHLPGGDLQLLWQQGDNHVYLVGPAEEIFTGDWPDN